MQSGLRRRASGNIFNSLRNMKNEQSLITSKSTILKQQNQQKLNDSYDSARVSDYNDYGQDQMNLMKNIQRTNKQRLQSSSQLNNYETSKQSKMTSQRCQSPMVTRHSNKDRLLMSAPSVTENHQNKLINMTNRGMSQFYPGNQTQIRQQEADSDHSEQNDNQQQCNNNQKQVKQDLKLRTKYYFRQSKNSQNNFEIECESSDENEVINEFAQMKIESESDLTHQKKTTDEEEFINIYKREYGMPAQEGNETFVKDYIFKHLEYKFSSDELSGEENQISRANGIIEDIQNEQNLMDNLPTESTDSISENMQTFDFTQLGNKGIIVLKKQDDTCAYKVVFVRHGQSIWNKEGRCSGWINVPLNEKGTEEAHEAGILLRELGYQFDLSYTSYLSRAYDTNRIILEELNQSDLDVVQAWQINERHYGALEGRYKKELEQVYGTEQVKLWRQSFDNPPPFVSLDDRLHPRFDRLYAHLSEQERSKLPMGESLQMVTQRVGPYWQDEILPHLMSLGQNKTMLITAHQHVCRGFVQALTGIDNEVVKGLRIPNAAPFTFEFNKDMKPLRNYYIDNEDVEIVDSQKIETKETLFMHGR